MTPAILVDQERMGANSRSTLGTATDAYSMLRRHLQPARRAARRPLEPVLVQRPAGHVPGVRGPRPGLDGRRRRDGRPRAGRSTRARSRCRTSASAPGSWRMYAESGHFDPDKRLADYSDGGVGAVPARPRGEGRDQGLNLKYEGLVNRFERTFLSKDVETAAAAHPRGDRARRHVRALPGVRRRAAQPGRARRDDRRAQHRRVRRDAGRRPRARSSPRSTRRTSRPRSTRCGTRSTASSRSGSAT